MSGLNVTTMQRGGSQIGGLCLVVKLLKLSIKEKKIRLTLIHGVYIRKMAGLCKTVDLAGGGIKL